MSLLATFLLANLVFPLERSPAKVGPVRLKVHSPAGAGVDELHTSGVVAVLELGHVLGGDRGPGHDVDGGLALAEVSHGIPFGPERGA